MSAGPVEGIPPAEVGYHPLTHYNRVGEQRNRSFCIWQNFPFKRRNGLLVIPPDEVQDDAPEVVAEHLASHHLLPEELARQGILVVRLA